MKVRELIDALEYYTIHYGEDFEIVAEYNSGRGSAFSIREIDIVDPPQECYLENKKCILLSFK